MSQVDYLKLTIDALYDCKENFTKEDLIKSLENKGFEVKDIDALVDMFLKVGTLVKNGSDTYRVDVTTAFNHWKENNFK